MNISVDFSKFMLVLNIDSHFVCYFGFKASFFKIR